MNKRMNVYLGFLILSLLLNCNKNSANSQVQENSLNLRTGTNMCRIEYGGKIRETYILLPSDLQEGTEYPVIFFFHGLGGVKEWGRSVLNSLLEDEDFIGISPQGYENSWNAGSGGVPSTEDDVGFSLKKHH